MYFECNELESSHCSLNTHACAGALCTREQCVGDFRQQLFRYALGEDLITLSAHAQRGYGSWVCVSVCYLTSHFSNVRLSHKRYDLPNGQ